MKLAILGGGGFRVPLVYRALLDDTGERRVDRVTLYDTDRRRLDAIGAVLDQLAAEGAGRVDLESTSDLDTALRDADFVFSAIRVGGLAGRTTDERIALAHGVLGQETTGPGGLAYALRTVPVVRRIAERVADVAPRAYVINFTNPAGIVTEAMQAVLGDRVIGICDTPSALGARAVSLLGLDPTRTRLDYLGLNHLGWLRGIWSGGSDHLPTLLGSDELLTRTEEAQLFGEFWLRALGALPNEYLYYYYFNRDARAKAGAAESTRGEFLLAQQDRFYREVSADPSVALRAWRRTLAEREATYMAEARAEGDERAGGEAAGGGYEDIALGVMSGIARDERSTMIVNVRNGHTIPGLPSDAVIEVPSLVDATGVRPLTTEPPDLHQLGLMQQVKAVERLIIEAAVDGSTETAVRAFASHPLVDSVTVARQLVEAYRSARTTDDGDRGVESGEARSS